MSLILSFFSDLKRILFHKRILFVSEKVLSGKGENDIVIVP